MSVIGTHSGKFHCDEVFACYMLKTLPQFKNHVIVRTRDPAVLETCDVVVDVGGVFDPTTKRFDHHQRTFMDTMKTLNKLNYNTKLSSAGLVYAHFGEEVIAKLLGISVKNSVIPFLYDKLYECFVESVDAIDNGVQLFDGEPKYQLASTLTSRVDYLNPAWNDKNSQPDVQFDKAMVVVSEEFESRVNYLYKSWIPARELVREALEARKSVHSSGKILEIKPVGVPYKSHFFALEKELGLEAEDICLVLYADETNSSWRIQAIPVSEKSGFNNRICLPWLGLRDAELSAASGVEGAIFVHMNGFIGGAKTRDGALTIGVEALRQARKIAHCPN